MGTNSVSITRQHQIFSLFCVYSVVPRRDRTNGMEWTGDVRDGEEQAAEPKPSTYRGKVPVCLLSSRKRNLCPPGMDFWSAPDCIRISQVLLYSMYSVVDGFHLQVCSRAPILLVLVLVLETGYICLHHTHVYRLLTTLCQVYRYKQS